MKHDKKQGTPGEGNDGMRASSGTAGKAADRAKRSAKPVGSEPTTGEYDLGIATRVNGVAQALSRLASFDDILEYLIELVCKLTQSERGSLFLHDPSTSQLYTRVALGNLHREIRIDEGSGIAGHVFTSGEPLIVNNPYEDQYFDQQVDQQTGFTTTCIACVPIIAMGDNVIGVLEVLNQQGGSFSEPDIEALTEITAQCSATLHAFSLIERMETAKQREIEFMNLVSNLTTELDLGTLLNQVVDAATEMLQAERATIFLNDDRTNELFSLVGAGLESQEIRFPNHIGIAGTVFQDGNSVNIPHAYADLRFNPDFDKKTGFFTRSILCVPIVNKDGRRIGVTQVLNKIGTTFTPEDESRIQAFTGQISIGLENAKLFGEIRTMKNYTDSMLQSMSNGVITVDGMGTVKSLNGAAERILSVEVKSVIGKPAEELLGEDNDWLIKLIDKVCNEKSIETLPDATLVTRTGRISANLSLQPMVSGEGDTTGALIVVEDISSEKRVRATMSRYMDPALAAKLLDDQHGQALLGGQTSEATILFSDIRSFTTLTESLGAQGTVALLNDYFEIMVGCITDKNGMLDKFIGDAIMAGFGVPLPRDDAVDAAVQAAIAMITRLRDWNRKRVAENLMEVHMGVGINTDSVVTGNIGSSKRMDFTMIGDGVNLASRLEGACKIYGTQIIISEFTKERLKGIYALRELDRIVVKGKTKQVSIYEVLDFHDDESFPNRMSVVDHFTEGLKLYREADFARASHEFERALVANDKDKPSALYIERCRTFMESPPPEDWTGEWIMTEK
jgi:adenylate cyclase